MLKLQRFKAAAVRTSPVYLNASATADKAASLVREAAADGARLVAFPEVFVPGYPLAGEGRGEGGSATGHSPRGESPHPPRSASASASPASGRGEGPARPNPFNYLILLGLKPDRTWRTVCART
ncbi:nitrilase-related carbon-nitrogen hydrolase [Bradyrhizobium guangzhouense]|uniref:CN hydrolase domain-containing protein n=1 Tax=Bradyrhizobium guangzhouense TaxID=1325095 RepID=A0AAE5X2Z1_9BRAD|nr:nitrilase-related carbon-nitrogen hydrolase [Bradyrhizobium guangzhouense]QAU47821.1 hypothetical protein XH91_22380 [Bradyrhizobium guangzhouense]RXH15040.1 hypothetical protein EAS56_10930 [Bradyrhizobium guangzhouense]